MLALGSSPKLLGHEQKSFVSVASSQCTSSPITISQPSGSVMPSAPSRAAATRNMVTSSRASAITWMPTGRPSSPTPKGTDMAGWPARFDGIVQTSLRYMASGSALAPSSNAVVGEVGDSRTSKRS